MSLNYNLLPFVRICYHIFIPSSKKKEGPGRNRDKITTKYKIALYPNVKIIMKMKGRLNSKMIDKLL